MYKISAFYFLLAAGLKQTDMKSMDEILTYANSIGITELDMSHAEIDDSTPELLKKTGMSVASVHGVMPCEFSNKERYIASLDKMKRAVDKAVFIGSPYFMCVPKPPMDMEKTDTPRYFEAARRMFSDMCEYAKDLPVTVTVENASSSDVPFARFEDIDYLLYNNPSLMMTYDGMGFPLNNHDEVEAAKRYASRVVYVHLDDLKIVDHSNILRNGKYYDSLELGGGFLKNTEVLTALRDGGFTSGTINIEINSDFDQFSRTVKSAEWLKTALASL